MDDTEFPQAVCSNDQPHARHRIDGTWRQECPGIAAESTRVNICRLVRHGKHGWSWLATESYDHVEVSLEWRTDEDGTGLWYHVKRGWQRMFSGPSFDLRSASSEDAASVLIHEQWPAVIRASERE